MSGESDVSSDHSSDHGEDSDSSADSKPHSPGATPDASDAELDVIAVGVVEHVVPDMDDDAPLALLALAPPAPPAPDDGIPPPPGFGVGVERAECARNGRAKCMFCVKPHLI